MPWSCFPQSAMSEGSLKMICAKNEMVSFDGSRLKFDHSQFFTFFFIVIASAHNRDHEHHAR